MCEDCLRDPITTGTGQLCHQGKLPLLSCVITACIVEWGSFSSINTLNQGPRVAVDNVFYDSSINTLNQGPRVAVDNVFYDQEPISYPMHL